MIFETASADCEEARDTSLRDAERNALSLAPVSAATYCAGNTAPRQVIGIATMVGAGTFVLTGIPLIVAGAWQVPIDGDARGPIPEVHAGPTSAHLRWTF